MTNSNKAPYHHGNLKEALIATAVELIRQDGAEKLSLRGLAKAVGVSQTAIYRHFEDKNHLLVNIAIEGFHMLAEATRQATQHITDPQDRIIACGLNYIRFAAQHPESYKLMFGPMIQNRDQHEALRTAGTAAFDLIVESAQLGIDQKQFVPLPPEVIASACWSNVHGIASLNMDGFYNQSSEAERAYFFEVLLKVNMRGILMNPEFSVDMDFPIPCIHPKDCEK